MSGKECELTNREIGRPKVVDRQSMYRIVIPRYRTELDCGTRSGGVAVRLFVFEVKWKGWREDSFTRCV
jgi:hypothetical protein